MACKTFHKGKYYVTFKRGFEDSKKDITVVVDKVFETDSLKITLSDEDNPQFLCAMMITRLDYEDLKKQQGLLVDFDNFPSQLVRLLQQCASNNMFLIMQQTNPIQYFFEVVEHNEFKRLVHLSLKTGPATDADVKQHMADTIVMLKKNLSSLKNMSTSTEAVLNDKCINLERKVLDLSHVVTSMEEEKLCREKQFEELLKQEREKLELERQQMKKHADLNMKSQMGDFQESLSKKDRQMEELNNACKQLKDNISHLENQISEKSHRLMCLEKEVQKTHLEVATLKAKNGSLEQTLAEKDKQINQHLSKSTYLEKMVKDNSDTIRDLNNSLTILRKEKTSLEERLALSESLVKKNNDAVQSTSEQLLKANQIISKQNADLIEMKEKLLCRTAIVLEQEKVIERNAKEMGELTSQISSTNEQLDKLMRELNDIKEKNGANESALKERDETIKNNNMVIQWLHKKLENYEPSDMLHNSKGIHSATSTPYFLSKEQTRSSHGVSEESLDFYASSKVSNIEESPGPDMQDKRNHGGAKVGLDPKYLRPATEAQVIKHNVGRSSENKTQKGKENVNINLPKVDYREKKSARGSTYRATPVSAYFP